MISTPHVDFHSMRLMYVANVGLHLSSHIKGHIKQASKTTDFTIDLTWWGLLRLIPIISSYFTDSKLATVAINHEYKVFTVLASYVH